MRVQVVTREMISGKLLATVDEMAIKETAADAIVGRRELHTGGNGWCQFMTAIACSRGGRWCKRRPRQPWYMPDSGPESTVSVSFQSKSADACAGEPRTDSQVRLSLRLDTERVISEVRRLHGNLPLVQIKRSHARQFREALQEVPGRRNGKLLNASLPELAEWGHEHPDVPKITAGTVNKQLTAVQAIANWAHDNGMIPDDVQWADPFRRMRLGDDEAVRGGAPFELSDLQVIFGTPIFTEGARPTGGQGDAAFWLPLLALFTGSRLNELASLKASDISHNEIIGSNCIFPHE